jgi:hypothetical protein
MDALSYLDWCAKMKEMAKHKDEKQVLELLKKAVNAIDNATMATIKWAHVSNVVAIPWSELYQCRKLLIGFISVISKARFE